MERNCASNSATLAEGGARFLAGGRGCGTAAVQQAPPAVASSRIGSRGWPRRVERSAAASAPILISLTWSKPWVMTSMLDCDDGFAELAELLDILLVDDFAVLLLGDSEFVEQGADGEECAEEGVALHAELQIATIGGLLGDGEAGQREDANVLVDDLLARPQRQTLPGLLAFFVGFPQQAAALGHAVERVGVGEGFGVAAENDGDMAQVAVDTDAVFGGDHEVAGGRAFFLGTVFGIGADVDDFLGVAEVVDSGRRARREDR